MDTIDNVIVFDSSKKRNLGSSVSQVMSNIPSYLNPSILRLNPSEINQVEQFSKADFQLFYELQELSKVFIENTFKQSSQETSKFFLTFSLNYYLLGIPTLARNMLSHVNLYYIETKLIEDLKQAIEYRNKADELERRKQFEQANYYFKQAEFFLVVTKILPFLKDENWFYQSSECQKFLKELENTSFPVKLAPKMELV